MDQARSTISKIVSILTMVLSETPVQCSPAIITDVCIRFHFRSIYRKKSVWNNPYFLHFFFNLFHLFIPAPPCHCSSTGSRTPTPVSTWPRTWKETTARWRWSCRPTWTRRPGATAWETTSITTPTASPTRPKSPAANQRTSASWSPPPSLSLSSVSDS